MTRLVRTLATSLPLALLACSHSTSQSSSTATATATATASASAEVSEPLTDDTPSTTVAGNTFIAPAGWTRTVRGPATVLTPPEPGSAIALVDLRAPSADSAVAAAWRAYKPDAAWPLKVVNPKPDRDGWTDRANYSYQTSPNEKRDVGVDVQRANGTWTVAIYDMGSDVGEKRLGQISTIFGQLLPKGYRARPSPAARPAASTRSGSPSWAPSSRRP